MSPKQLNVQNQINQSNQNYTTTNLSNQQQHIKNNPQPRFLHLSLDSGVSDCFAPKNLEDIK